MDLELIIDYDQQIYLFELDYNDRIAPRVLDERIHFLINDMMKDVVQQGTAKKRSHLADRISQVKQGPRMIKSTPGSTDTKKI